MSSHALTESNNTSTLTLYTSEAEFLCFGTTKTQLTGRKRPPSVFSFSITINKFWTAARHDDPYAEWALIHIEKRLERAFTRLALYSRMLDKYKKRWQQPDGLSLELLPFKPKKQIAIDTNLFRTPHALQLLILISRFDVLIQRLMTYRQFGIINNTKMKRLKRRATRHVRATLHESRAHRISGITRQDILERTTVGQSALKKLGILPLVILHREQTSEYGPTPLHS